MSLGRREPGEEPGEGEPPSSLPLVRMGCGPSHSAVHESKGWDAGVVGRLMIKEACSNDYWLEYLKKRDGKKRNLSKSEFIEYQANQIMVGLLMPFNTLYNQAAQTIKFKLDSLHKENGWSRGFSIRARLPDEC